MRPLTIKKDNNFIAYLLVVIAIYLSGNPLFHMIRYKQSVIVVFFISLTLFLLFCSKLRVNRAVFVAVAFLAICVCGTIVFTGASETSTYISIVLQILSAFFIISVVDYDKFESVFVNIITFLMVCSLFFFFVQRIIPDIWKLFPLEQGTYVTYANVGYLYNYFWLPKEGNYILPRNAGIFWEPGCYQFFLNIALILLLDRAKRNSSTIDNKTFYLVLLYVVTLITTKSATGLFLLILIIVVNFKYITSIFRKKHSSLSKVAAVLVIIVAIVSFLKLDVMTVAIESLSKISSEEYMDGKGILKRLSLDSFVLIFENFYRVFGLSFEKLYSMSDYSVWNSIIEDALALGLPFVIITLIGIFKYSMCHYNKIILFIVFIASLSAEALFHTVIIFVIMLYGYQKSQLMKGNRN